MMYHTDRHTFCPAVILGGAHSGLPQLCIDMSLYTDKAIQSIYAPHRNKLILKLKIQSDQNNLEVFSCLEDFSMEIPQGQINVPSVVASLVSVVQCWPFHLHHILVELYDAGRQFT